MRFRILVLLIVVIAQVVSAQTEVHLRIEAETFTKLPVELKECQPLQQANMKDASRVLDILDNDLWMSSLIASFRTDEQLADSSSPWLELASRGPMQPFRLTVLPKVEIAGDKVKIAADLVDSRSKRTLAQKSYDGCQKNFRLLVHSLADDIVNVLTGEKGIAKSRIAFTAKSLSAKEIFVMDFDGTNVRQVTNNGSLNLTPAWSQDSRMVGLTSYLDGNPNLLFLTMPAGKISQHQKQRELQAVPAWSPDGKRIAYISTHEGNAEIYVMDLQGKNRQRLTHHPAVDTSPSWSPTGREIVFTSDRLGGPQLFIMDAEGSNLRRLTTEGSYNDSPSWSPKGDKIAYVARIESRFNIMTIDVATQVITQLTSEQGSNEDPCWSPDGYRIVFSSTRGGGSDLYSMEWNGSNLRRLTHKGTCTSPAWSNNVVPEEEYNCN